MRKSISFLILSLVTVFFCTSLNAQNTAVKHKVVIQLNTADTSAFINN